MSLTDFLTLHFSFGDNILLSSCFCSLSITSSCILSLTQMQAAFACYRMIHSGSCAVWHSTIVPSSNVQIASQTLSFICAVIVTKRDEYFSLNMLTSIYHDGIGNIEKRYIVCVQHFFFDDIRTIVCQIHFLFHLICNVLENSWCWWRVITERPHDMNARWGLMLGFVFRENETLSDL